MEERRTKTDELRDEVRLGLEQGQYAAGDRIDPEALAKKFHTSLTPVRYALHGLSLLGVLEDRGRAGFHVPLPTEFELHDRYDWMAQMLSLTNTTKRPLEIEPPARLEFNNPNANVVTLTRQLFDTMAFATGSPSLCDAVRVANDKLAALRNIEQALIHNALDELSNVHRIWLKANVASLQSALKKYHQRRTALVPLVVATLTRKRR